MFILPSEPAWIHNRSSPHEWHFSSQVTIHSQLIHVLPTVRFCIKCCKLFSELPWSSASGVFTLHTCPVVCQHTDIYRKPAVNEVCNNVCYSVVWLWPIQSNRLSSRFDFNAHVWGVSLKSTWGREEYEWAAPANMLPHFFLLVSRGSHLSLTSLHYICACQVILKSQVLVSPKASRCILWFIFARCNFWAS